VEVLDSNILEKTGDEVATLSKQLEYIFGWKAHTSDDGIIYPNSQMRKCHLQPFTSEINPDINNNSMVLRDMILIKPLVRESIPQASTASRVAVASNAEPDWGW
jgi:hypothetical protein